MVKYNRKKVYIISGPAGVGKSTVAKSLATQLSNSAYISGDMINGMYLNDHQQKTRENKQASVLLWYNIYCLTKNFSMFNIETVIDFTTFPNEAMWLKRQLATDSIDISYIVLWTDKQTLLKRDKQRPVLQQSKEKCTNLHNQFLATNINQKHFLDTTTYSINDISLIVSDIMTSPLYLLE